MFGSSVKVFDCIDVHCEGEPARVVVGGFPPVKGNTMAEKRLEIIDKHKDISRLLLREPRGYPCQNLNIVFPSELKGIDWGFVTCEQNDIFPLFSGHNTMCVVTALLETGRIHMTEPETKFQLEASGGTIDVTAQCSRGKAIRVTLTSMPSFVAFQNKKLTMDGFPDGIEIDCAFGGMWYVIVDADKIGVKIRPQDAAKIAKIGEEIKAAAQKQFPVVHPVQSDYIGPDILVFTSNIQVVDPGLNFKIVTGVNTVVMSTGKSQSSAILDRSPCGSGTAAVMANLYAKGVLKIGDRFVHKSVLGLSFDGKLIGAGPKVGIFDTVVPQISGQSFITGFNQIIVHPDDPLQLGYTVGDIWAE